jgi:hypothetical protein
MAAAVSLVPRGFGTAEIAVFSKNPGKIIIPYLNY